MASAPDETEGQCPDLGASMAKVAKAEEVEQEQADLQAAVDSWDKLADEGGNSAMLAGLVWVFALDWITGYESDQFTNPDGEHEQTLHAVFVIFLAITVAGGCFGVIVLSIWVNTLKNMGFQVSKLGRLTADRVAAMSRTGVLMDKVAYVARFFGIFMAFPSFGLAAMVYMWVKVVHNDGSGSKGQGIVIVSIISVFSFAAYACCLFMMWRYKQFRDAINLVNEKDGHAEKWYNTAFSKPPAKLH